MADETTYYTTDDTGAYMEATLPSFQDSIPENLRKSEHLKGYGDAGAMAQALIDFHSNAPEIPETADGYTMPDIPEGVPADTEAIAGFKTLAHELKLPQATVDRIIKFDFDRAKRYSEFDTKQAQDAVASLKKAREAAHLELDKEWGKDKAVKMEAVAKVKTRFLDADTIKRWDEAGISDDPALIRLLGNLGSAIDEGHLVLPDTRTTGEIPRGPDGLPILKYNTG